MTRRPAYRERILLLTLYAFLPALFAALYMAGNTYSFMSLLEPYNLSIIAGAAAYVTFMAQFFLSARIRFLERIIPQDRLLALHGLTGMITAGLVLAHFVLKYLLIIRYGGITLQSALGIGALVIYAVLAPGALLVLRGRRAARRGGSPPYRRALMGHNLFALAGALAVVHVLAASSTWSPGLRIFTVLWGALALGAYVYHKLLRPRGRMRFILESVREAAPGVHRYEFRGDSSRAPMRRQAGQFGYWAVGEGPRRAGGEPAGATSTRRKLEPGAEGKLGSGGKPGAAGEPWAGPVPGAEGVPGAGGIPGVGGTPGAPIARRELEPWAGSVPGITSEEHPFTLASPPGENPAVVVRGSGDYTAAMPFLQPGTAVYFDGPYGHFTPSGLPEGTPLLLLAGGIGITPFLSMSGDEVLRRMYPMTLLWSVRTREECGIAPEFLESGGAADAVTVKIVCSGEEGRAGRKDVDEMLDAAGKEHAEVFICGPSGFTEAMRGHLRGLRVARSRIHSERFGW